MPTTPGAAPITVFLVDDHAVVRRGLASYLDGEDDILVVGQADNGRRAIDELAVLANTARLPDVVLMDLLMPELGGVEATRLIIGRWPQVRVIAVTSFLEEQKVRAALDAGASGYILKDAPPDEVIAAVRAVAAGGAPLDPRAARVLLDRQRTARPSRSLSAREREVLGLLAQGLPNKQIARRLGISDRTVKAHLTNVFQQLGVTDRTQAALWAKENLDPDDGGSTAG